MRLTTVDIDLLLDVLNNRLNWIDGEPFALSGGDKADNDALIAKLSAMKAEIAAYNKRADDKANAALRDMGIATPTNKPDGPAEIITCNISPDDMRRIEIFLRTLDADEEKANKWRADMDWMLKVAANMRAIDADLKSKGLA